MTSLAPLPANRWDWTRTARTSAAGISPWTDTIHGSWSAASTSASRATRAGKPSSGDWREALRLIEAQRSGLSDLSRLAARHRCRLLRVRVVETPLTPYLQWELHLLRVRAECGELIRVLGPEPLAAYEATAPVPELITLNDDTVYEIRYDAEGVLEGAVRHLDTGARDRVAAWIEKLYGLGRTSARSSTVKWPLSNHAAGD